MQQTTSTSNPLGILLAVLILCVAFGVMLPWRWLFAAAERRLWPDQTHRPEGAKRLPRCPQCRYLLVSLTASTCPECGVDLIRVGVHMSDEYMTEQSDPR